MLPPIDAASWVVHEHMEVLYAMDGLCIEWVGLVHINDLHVCIGDGVDGVDDL